MYCCSVLYNVVGGCILPNVYSPDSTLGPLLQCVADNCISSVGGFAHDSTLM